MKIDPSFAEEAISLAVKSGAEQAEIFMKSYKNLTVDIRGQEVDSLTSSLSYGYGLRVIRKNRLGFAYSTDVKEIQSVIKHAVESTDFSDEDCYLELPGPSGTAKTVVYDPAVSEMKEDEAINLAKLLERSALDTDGRIKKVRKASGSFTTAETVIVNTEAVNTAYLSTSCTAGITAIAEDGQEGQTGSDFSGSRFLSDVSFEKTGQTAAKRSLQLLGARTMAGARTNVLLDNSVTIDFLGIFASSLSSETLQKGKSLLKDKLGKTIISPGLDIIDSGLLFGKLGSRPVDDEGVPSRENILVQEGVLRTYIYNTYTARKGNARSTGNASRGGFASLPSVGITNLFIGSSNGKECLARGELFKSLGRGLYIVDAMGVHTANPVSGDFSLGVTGLWIEGGEVCFPVKEAVISGNVLEFFNKVAAIGDDLTFYGNMGAPSIIIPDVDISA